MKKIYLAIICVLFLVFISLNKRQTTLSFVYNPSILANNYSLTKLISLNRVAKPKMISQEPINISVPSYLVIDQKTFSPLLTKNIHQKRYIGSLTKLMTSLVALENNDLGEVVTIKNIDFSKIPSHHMGLVLGERVFLKDLLYGMLIFSANDAAEAIALYVGEGNYNKFIALMNQKAQKIGMKNTHFANAMGLDNPDNYSTAFDLALLANYALKNDFIRKAVQIKEKQIKSVDGKDIYDLVNTNQLLFNETLNILGVKTGETPWAGECLIALAENEEGNKIIVIILGSEDRFSDAKKLIQWVWRNVVWE